MAQLFCVHVLDYWINTRYFPAYCSCFPQYQKLALLAGNYFYYQEKGGRVIGVGFATIKDTTNDIPITTKFITKCVVRTSSNVSNAVVLLVHLTSYYWSIL